MVNPWLLGDTGYPLGWLFIPPSGRGTQGLTCMYAICIYLSVDPKIKGFFYVCILYTHHMEVSISFNHSVLTWDQMILGNVLLYPMAPLGYLPSLKSRSLTYHSLPELFSGSN